MTDKQAAADAKAAAKAAKAAEAEAAKQAAADAKAAPESVTLESVYAFMDDAGQIFQWAEGHIETDVEKIKMLIERKAPIKEAAK